MAVRCENMIVDDPWKGVSGSLDAEGAFEDNFEPCSGEGKQLDEKTHYEMPDREQYLESLEAKLRKIKGNKKTEREEARRMVQEMQIHKEDRWGSAMHDVIPIDFSGDFQEDPCAAPFIVRFLFPERSALTADELQKLVDNDCLTALVDQEGDPVTLNQDADTSSPEHSV